MVGIILVVVVSIALVALGANIVFNLSEDTNEPVRRLQMLNFLRII